MESFFHEIGIKKVPSSEFAKGRLEKFCKFIYIYNKELWFTDKMIYDIIERKKEKLFKNRDVCLENIDINELIESINKRAKKVYGEEFKFNKEDKRFYLNDELLNRHENYIRTTSLCNYDQKAYSELNRNNMEDFEIGE